MMKKMVKISLGEIKDIELEIIETGFADGKHNMDFDIERMKKVAEGTEPNMFRLYGWKPWCVSLGANQKENEIDPERCRNFGLDIVRRPTGGRAVLHADELTYSVVIRLASGFTVQDYYREIHTVLLDGLRKIGGGELGFQKSQPDFRRIYLKEARAVSCFASSARYEIEYRGKKVVGSAQRLFSDTLLQHGSILLGKGYEQLADVIRAEQESTRDTLREFTLKHSISLSELTGKEVSFGKCSEALIDSIISRAE